MSSINAGSLFTGLVMILFGVVFMLEEFDVVAFGDVMRRYWPMIIVLLGAAKLFDRKTVWNGLWLAAIGVWLQAALLNAFGMTIRSSWPLLMIIFGAGVIARAIGEMRRSSTEENHGA